MEDIKVALVQMESVSGDTLKNINKIEKYTKYVKNKNAQIICFPELAVHGYNKSMKNELAENIPGPITERISFLAKSNNITVLTGMMEKSKNGNVHISQIICTNSGKTYVYRKTHLGLSEQTEFCPGNKISVYNTDNVCLGIQICWETHFPEICTIQSLKGAEVIFTPFASPDKAGNRRDIWLKYLTARAYDNSVFVAACNLIGSNGAGVDFSGGCLVIDPKGNVIAEDFTGKEGVLIADLPKNEINLIRSSERKSMKYSCFINYRRKELYGDLV